MVYEILSLILLLYYCFCPSYVSGIILTFISKLSLLIYLHANQILFQVYMASVFEDQYKLLARSGNKIQEVML